MSNESRTMLVVLLVCGLLMFGCIVLPVGLGAAFFFMASQRAEVAAAERAIAAEQVARAQAAQAQADAQAAQQALQNALPTPPSPIGVPGVPGLPPTPALPSNPPVAAIPPPPISDPASLKPPADVLPEIAALLADVEQRKALYRVFKPLQITEEEMKKNGASDPAAAALFASTKQQIDQIMQASGFPREQIDKILAEGDKEGWK